jgi:hypothetical protein
MPPTPGPIARSYNPLLATFEMETRSLAGSWIAAAAHCPIRSRRWGRRKSSMPGFVPSLRGSTRRPLPGASSSICSVHSGNLSAIWFKNARMPALRGPRRVDEGGGRKPIVVSEDLERARATVAKGLTVREGRHPLESCQDRFARGVTCRKRQTLTRCACPVTESAACS